MPILILVVVLLFMVVEAISVAVAAAVFLDLSLSYGWHAAWDRPGWLLVFALISLLFQSRDRR